MKQLILPLMIVAFAAVSCVPRTQYTALETERNYYRNQSTLADSLADQRAISSYDEVDLNGNELTQRIQQVESLTATNMALNQSYQSLQKRYEELLGQNQKMLSNTGSEVSGLQQSLAERTTQVSEREAELRQFEHDLKAREAAIARIEGDYSPAGGGSPASPEAYGTSAVRGLSNSQNAALRINEIQNSLSQILAAYPVTSYSLINDAPNKLRITLAESMLSTDGYTVSSNGQNLLRSIAAVLRNQSSAEAFVIGHTDSSNPNALRAYEDSSDKAINVAQQLINFGMSPRKITIGGKGFYDPVTNGITQRDLASNRRTELLILVEE